MISFMSALKLPESASTSQLRVWVIVCMDPVTVAPSTGHVLTCVPLPSWRTRCGCIPAAVSTSFTVHMQSRSSSITGWAVENTCGRGLRAPNESPPQLAALPTSPRNPSDTGSTSTGRPTSHVAKSRPFHVSGAVFAMFAWPNGDSSPRRPPLNLSRALSCSRHTGVSIVRTLTGMRPGAAPWVPGVIEMRIIAPNPNSWYDSLSSTTGALTNISPWSPAGHVPDVTSRSRSANRAVKIDSGRGTGELYARPGVPREGPPVRWPTRPPSRGFRA